MTSKQSNPTGKMAESPNQPAPSDTPRTDNELAWRDGECVTDALTRHANFARQLERELTRLSAEREKEREELRTKHEVACQTITTMQEERANRESYTVLSNLSSFLGAGSGDGSVSAADYDKRIRWGIDEILKVETQRREAAEATLAASERQRKDLLYVAKLAYRKHHLDDPDIGWNELGDKLCNAMCNAMGDDSFQAWLKTVSNNES